MSTKYPGGIISKTAPTPSGPYSTDTAPGIWTLEQQAYWQKLGQWPTAGNYPKDAQFNYVTMLLHGDGTNGAQNNTFLDSSTNNFTITRNGNTTQGSFSPYGSNWSNYFDGTGDYLSTANNSANLGTGDFNITFWINLTTAPSNGVPATNVYNAGAFTNGWYFYTGDGTSLSFGLGSAGGADAVTATVNLIGTWHYIEVTRSGSTLSIYVDGVFATSKTNTNTGTVTGNNTKIGSRYDGTSGFITGYISNFKVVVGTAGNTANYTPPTAPATATTNTSLLTCQSNRFVDNSTNNFTITANGNTSVQRFNPFGASTAYSTSVIGGSGYFDGTRDYVSAPANSVFSLTGDFCIEGWIYQTRRASDSTVLELNDYQDGILMRLGSGSSYDNLFINNTDYVAPAQYFPLNQFNHFAITRSGTTVRLFSNGVQVWSNTISGTINSVSGGIRFGEPLHTTSQNFQGWMSDCRVIKGSAVYTSAFTPPTAPLTAITNTSLLLNFTNGAIFDNAMMNDLETVGNAQISTSVVKYGTGSLAFDGTGDWMLGVNGQTINFGSGDFTVEFWINPTNWSNTYVGVIGCPTTNGLWIGKNASNFVLRSSNTADLVSYGTMPTTGTWTHIAITRSGTTARMFYDGTQVASGTTSNNFVEGSFYIGQDSGGNAFTGYLDDLRITKGYARYTANFTPPTAAFPNIGPN